MLVRDRVRDRGGTRTTLRPDGSGQDAREASSGDRRCHAPRHARRSCPGRQDGPAARREPCRRAPPGERSLTPTGSERPLPRTLQAAITSNMTEPRRRAALDTVILRPHIARTTEWADAPSCTAQRSVDYWEEWRSPSASTVNLPFIAPS